MKGTWQLEWIQINMHVARLLGIGQEIMPAANFYYFEFQKWNNLCKFIESISLILLYFLLRDIYQIRLYLGLTWLCYN